MFHIGNPGLLGIGDPSILLGYQYWLQKWMPDPPPEARDAMVLWHLYVLGGLLSEEAERNEVQGTVLALLSKRSTTEASPTEPTPTYTSPPTVEIVGVVPTYPRLAALGDQFTVQYRVWNVPPEGANLGVMVHGPNGDAGSSQALAFPEYTEVTRATNEGTFLVIRGEGDLATGDYTLLLTATTWMDTPRKVPFAVVDEATGTTEGT